MEDQTLIEIVIGNSLARRADCRRIPHRLSVIVRRLDAESAIQQAEKEIRGIIAVDLAHLGARRGRVQGAGHRKLIRNRNQLRASRASQLQDVTILWRRLSAEILVPQNVEDILKLQ